MSRHSHSSSDLPSRREQVSEGEDDLIRRLSADAKLRIYEEVKELLDAKAARDAMRSPPTTHATGLAAGLSPALKTQVDSDELRRLRDRRGGSDASDDLVRFTESGSYDVPPGSEDPASRVHRPESSRAGGSSRRRSKESAEPAPSAQRARKPEASEPLSAYVSAAKPSKRFTLLTGLTQEQVKLLRSAGTRQKFEEGESIYSKGDKSDGVNVILRGRVELRAGDKAVNSPRRSGEWFGELEMMNSMAHRRLSAVAVKPTSLFEIPGNPLELFRWLSDRKAATRLLRNAICLMGRHLRELAENPPAALATPATNGSAGFNGRSALDWEEIKALLPAGLLGRVESCRSFSESRLLDGQHLYREGDSPDGFYFIQSGTLDIYKRASGRSKKLATLTGPMIFGDVSFFSHQDRSVGVKAFGPVQLLRFSGDRFERVRRRDAEEMLDLLLLAAELAGGFLAARQPGGRA